MTKRWSKELYHHGIKGMKWGVRRFQNKDGTLTALGKRREQRDNKRPSKSINEMLSDIRKAVSQEDRDNVHDKLNHNRIVEESERTGKSAAEIEQEQSTDKKLRLSESQKKAIAIGAVAAGTALAVYGAYKYKKIYDERKELQAKGKTGDTDFLRNAFSDYDYKAYTKSQSDKKIVNNLLTEESGNWWSSLSDDERKGIEKYSGMSYKEMNNALWAAKGDNIDDYASPKIAKAIKDANSALSKARFPDTMICTQGLSCENAAKFLGISKEELITAACSPSYAEKLIGAVNTNHGLFSTTTASSGGFSGGVKYKVLTPKGAHAQYIEHISRFGDIHHPPSWDGKESGGPPFSSEFETLFEAGSKFATRGIQWNSEEKCIEVALEYILPDEER